MESPSVETATMNPSTVETAPVKPSAIEKRMGGGVRSEGAVVPCRMETVTYMRCRMSREPGCRVSGQRRMKIMAR